MKKKLQKRAIVYMPDDFYEKEYREVRAKLVGEGKTFSQWVRDQMATYLKV